MPIAIMGLIGFGLAFAAWHFMGRELQKAAQERRIAAEDRRRLAAAPKPPKRVVPPAPAGRIEMRRTKASIGQTAFWAVCFLIAAAGLALNPDALWTKWLTYPAAVVALAISVFLAYLAWNERSERIVADANGIYYGDSPSSIRVSWKDVATATLVEEADGQYLLLKDKEGEELMRVEELDPPEEYRRFLHAVPAWTRLEVKIETVSQ